MNPIKEIIDTQKENHKQEYAELFEKVHQSIIKKFQEISPVIDIEYSEGYFIFYYGKNSVCHFKLKKYPQWSFGIWLDYVPDEKDSGKDYIRAEVFCQLTQFIDKFKPSRSEFLSEIRFYKIVDIDEDGEISKLNEFDLEIDDWEIHQFNLLWKRPYLAMYKDLCSVDFNSEFVRPLKAFLVVKKEFLQERLHERKVKRANKFMARKIRKWINKEAPKVFCKYEFDFSDSGENVSPRFHPSLTIHEGVSNEVLNDFEQKYRDYRDAIARKKFRNLDWRYDNFGWIYWYEFSENRE